MTLTTQFGDVLLATSNMEKNQAECLENTSRKMFIGNDKISEIVNDSDPDCGNCSEISDDVCKVSLVPMVAQCKA
jgi:hypothetical protein